MNILFKVSIAACLLLLSTLPGFPADSWDISTDYSSTSNPSGPWSYGRKSAVTSNELDLFTVRWSTSGWYLGNAGNGGPSVYSGPNLWAKANANGYPCARWICPKTGSYNVVGQFTGNDSRGVDNLVYVVVNGTTIFSSRVQAYLQAVPFSSQNLTLHEGDVVDFTLVWGGTGDSENGWTDVDAVISEVPFRILGGPVDQQIPEGGTARFGVSIDSREKATYQWQFNDH